MVYKLKIRFSILILNEKLFFFSENFKTLKKILQIFGLKFLKRQRSYKYFLDDWYNATIVFGLLLVGYPSAWSCSAPGWWLVAHQCHAPRRRVYWYASYACLRGCYFLHHVYEKSCWKISCSGNPKRYCKKIIKQIYFFKVPLTISTITSICLLLTYPRFCIFSC